MVFRIGGVDITKYIAFGGLKWQRNDIDSANAGRSMDGSMIRDRVAIKYRWDVTCRPLTSAELSIVLGLIQDEFLTVEFTDPLTNSVRTATYYSNNVPATFAVKQRNGVEYWTGVAFPLIEK